MRARTEVLRSGAFLVVLASVTGLLLNYWMLEGLVAEHSDPAASWISDLGARSQSTGWAFSVLDGVSGLALCATTWLLWPRLAHRSPLVRLGLVALAVAAVTTVVDGAAPLSCATALPPACTSRHDLLDGLHATESTVNVLGTVAAFALLGWGLLREDDLRGAGVATIVCGAWWVSLYALVLAEDLFEALGDEKGSFQRPAQVVNGLWVVVLAACVAHLPGRRP